MKKLNYLLCTTLWVCSHSYHHSKMTYFFPYLEPVCCSMSSSNCCFLSCIQISQEAGQVVWYSHLFKNFPQFVVIHTVKGFGIVNKAEIDVFLELSCFFDNPMDVGNLISASSAFSKTSLNIWKFMVPVLLKPGLENFEHYFTSVWDECNCAVVWAFFGIAFLWDLEWKLTSSVLWLSRLIKAFLPRSKHLLISWLQSPSAVILEAKTNKVSHCFHRFPIYLSWCDSIMSSANSAFYFFFNLDSFYIFSTLIATARASKIMLSKSGDNGHPWDFHIKWSQTKTDITHMWNIIFKNDTKELI